VCYVLISTRLLIIFGIRKHYQTSERNPLLYLSTRAIKLLCSNNHGVSVLSTTNKVLSNILQSRLAPYIANFLGIVSVEFNVINLLLIRCSAFVSYWRKNGEYYVTVHHLHIDFKEVYDSLWREVLCNILFELSVVLRPITLSKIWGSYKLVSQKENLI
jgi:hypothetical protein